MVRYKFGIYFLGSGKDPDRFVEIPISLKVMPILVIISTKVGLRFNPFLILLKGIIVEAQVIILIS